MTTIKNRITGEIMCNGLSLEAVLALHKQWLRGEEGGMHADLYCADLRGANLSGADLRYAELYGVDLQGADLRDVDLHNT